MTFYNRQSVLDEDLKPLMQEVGRICCQHSIQFVTCFQTAMIQETNKTVTEGNVTTGYLINDIDFPMSERMRLMAYVAHLPDEDVGKVSKKLLPKK